MSDLKNIIAKNMMDLRTSRNMTQAMLGEILNYSDKAVSKWERAEAVPDAYVLKQLSEYFQVSVDYLMSEHETPVPALPAPPNHKIYRHIMGVAFISIWTLALLIFICLWILGRQEYMVFVYTVPLSLIVLLSLNSLWGNAKGNFVIISALIWSVLATIYLAFLKHNLWPFFLLGVPIEIILFFGFRIYTIHRNR